MQGQKTTQKKNKKNKKKKSKDKKKSKITSEEEYVPPIKIPFTLGDYIPNGFFLAMTYWMMISQKGN